MNKDKYEVGQIYAWRALKGSSLWILHEIKPGSMMMIGLTSSGGEVQMNMKPGRVLSPDWTLIAQSFDDFVEMIKKGELTYE